MNLDGPLNNKVIKDFCCCHGNIVTIATYYYVSSSFWKYGIDEPLNNKVIKDFCCCHGNLVTIVTSVMYQ